MRRNDLIGTTMALSLAVFMSAVATGCGKKDTEVSVPQPEPIETMADAETTEPESIAEYEVITLAVPYTVAIAENTVLMDRPDTAGKIADLPRDSIITVVGDVNFGGVKQEYYYCQFDTDTTSLEGYVDGNKIDFNSKVEDSMMGYSEVEGGDGEEIAETTETEEVSTEPVQTEAAEVEPYVMYTNTDCNVRSEARKDSTLLMTLAKNVEVTVYGEENGWSKIDVGGMFAYIKSTLLSSTKTETPQQTASTPSQPTTQTETKAETSSQTDTQTQAQQTTPPSTTSPSTTPVENPDGTITVYVKEGYVATMSLWNAELGIYRDQEGIERNSKGEIVNPYTGEVYVEPPIAEAHSYSKEEVDAILNH